MCKRKSFLLFIGILLFAIFLWSHPTAGHLPIIWVDNPSESDITVSQSNFTYREGLYSIATLKGDSTRTASGALSGELRYGFVNQNGKWVIPPQYLWTTNFQNGYAIVSAGSMNEPIWQETQVIMKNGSIHPAFQKLFRNNIICQETDGTFFLCSKMAAEPDVMVPPTWTFGLYDNAGKEVLSPIYITLHLPRNGLCLVQTKQGYGFFDTTGKEIIRPQYDNAQDFSEGFAAIQENNKWGFIDKTGHVQIVPTYEAVQPFCEGLAAVKTNNLWGFINIAGELVVPAQYTAVQNFSEGITAVQQDDMWGVINKQGKILLPCQYEEVRSASDNILCVKYHGVYGYFDKTGKKIIDFQFEKARDFHNGFAAVTNSQNKYGLIDINGNIILPFKYSNISDVSDNTAIFQQNNDGKIGIVQLPIK